MTMTKIFITAMITILSTAALASTDCKARSGVGLTQNTNPQPTTSAPAVGGVKTHGAVGG